MFLNHLFFRFSIAWAEAGFAPEGQELILPLRLHTIFSNGYKGVYLFFVLSGFILALPFAKWRLRGEKQVRVADYYLRRLIRIEPPYIIAMVGFFFLWRAVEGSKAPGTAHLAASLGYAHHAVFGLPSLINIVAWTLEVEVQFYILAPLLSLVFLLRKHNLRILLLAVAALGCAMIAEHWKPQWFILFPYLAYFLTGMILSDLYTLHGSTARPAQGRMIPVLLFLVAAVFFQMLPLQGAWVYRLIFPALIAWMFVLIYRSSILRRIFSLRSVTLVGGMCYSIYLLHYGLMKWLFPYTIKVHAGGIPLLNFALQGIIFTLIVLIASGIFFVLVERPFMAWSRKRRGTGLAENAQKR